MRAREKYKLSKWKKCERYGDKYAGRIICNQYFLDSIAHTLLGETQIIPNKKPTDAAAECEPTLALVMFHG